ncbi:tRNA (adenosine(37)-N6)-threonylcarbamoyltransferase complex transferase subunit TsaD [Candidatus Fermentibacteria bacterium]|nr:tRNA (adenosine(37)-N6)-threonylcarbamoyltransferase complex transferase subunit TsaD [Candidatus Fermentibacteria bacterium]
MKVLGIETSCDDTCGAVVCDGAVASSVVSSQHAFHAAYGGVVPEIAARQHSRLLIPVIGEAMDRAGVTWGDLDAVAVTTSPGLIGALLVGVAAAKGICMARSLPLVPVNHLSAHLHTVFVAFPEVEVPHVTLLASGGHTLLCRVTAPGEAQVMGSTLDDAAGEAIDKAAHLLGLGYPGGPALDGVASRGNPAAVAFPRPIADRKGFDFSFSGLKTALAVYVRTHGSPADAGATSDLAASYLEAVVDVLVGKTITAAFAAGVSTVAMVGGVAANRRLRQAMAEACGGRGLRLIIPPPELCTDNGVMVAALGEVDLRRGAVADLAVEASAVASMPRWKGADAKPLVLSRMGDSSTAPCSGSVAAPHCEAVKGR